MSDPEIMPYEEEFRRLEESLRRLLQVANAKVVFLMDANGRQIASAGDTWRYDTTSLASLTAGNATSAFGPDRLGLERELTVLHHEGEEHVHLAMVADRAVLVVVFDDRSSLGLVRLRVKRARVDLEEILGEVARKAGRDFLPEIGDSALDARSGE